MAISTFSADTRFKGYFNSLAKLALDTGYQFPGTPEELPDWLTWVAVTKKSGKIAGSFPSCPQEIADHINDSDFQRVLISGANAAYAKRRFYAHVLDKLINRLVDAGLDDHPFVEELRAALFYLAVWVDDRPEEIFTSASGKVEFTQPDFVYTAYATEQ